jgi:hypothetical protein
VAILVLGALAAVSAVAGTRLLRQESMVAAPDVGQPPPAAPTMVTPGSGSAAPSVPARPRGAAERPAPSTVPAEPRQQPPAPPGPPLRLAIPADGVSAPVVPIGVRPDGSLALPDSPRTVGWWIGSAAAGDRQDGTLLAGHVDSAREGVGALAALRDLAPGARIVITDAFGVQHVYAVAARRSYPKYALPHAVFQIDGRPGLTLVTCGGPFDPDTRQYRDNVVVYAAPAP